MMRRLRIVSLVYGYLPGNGGGEVVLHELLRALSSRGHHCSVIVTRPGVTLMPYSLNGVEVKSISASPLLELRDAEVVISQGSPVTQSGALARECGLPFVHIIHDTGVYNSYAIRDLRPELVVFNSNWISDYYSYHGPNGIVVYPPLRPMKPVPPMLPTAVTLVNLTTIKGVNLFYELAVRNPDREFLGVTGGYGPQMTDSSPGNVVVTPFMTDIRNAWAKTRVLLVPSWYESYGLAAVEAMSVGIPVVASRTRGLHEALGSAALFADQDDIETWHRLLIELDNNDTYRDRSQKSISHAEQRATVGRRQLFEWITRVESLAI